MTLISLENLKSYSEEYSWGKCADETIKFIAETLLKSNK